MSPELLHSERLDSKDGYPTKESDRYALGMVIYEVLTGQPPFAQFKAEAVTQKVTRGDRPERPGGARGEWFTNGLWEILHRCWEAEAQNRPSIEAVRERLGLASKDWKPLPPQPKAGAGEDELDWDSSPLSVCILLPYVMCL